MTTITISRLIDAPAERVFETVSDITNFSKAIPHIVEVDFLTDSKVGVGTRFRETRVMQGKEARTELEVTEYVKDERVRLVADSHGTVWDTVFTVEDRGENTRLEMTMDATARKLLPKLINPLIMGMVKKAVASDMDAVKAYCESQEVPRSGSA